MSETTEPLRERCDECYVAAWAEACAGDDLAAEGRPGAARDRYDVARLWCEVGRAHDGGGRSP